MKKIFLSLVCLIFLCACGTKRQYFEPQQINGDLSHNDSLKAKIIDWNLASAKLSNNTAILKSGISIDKFKLPKNYMLLAYQDAEYVVADNDGNLKIFDDSYNEIYTFKYEASVVSVALNGDDLALVLANNTIVLANRSLGIKFSQTLTSAPAQDSRMANPIFLDNIVVYPTLDGKILILSINNLQIIKDVVISAENFFNNVIYLNVFEDKLIAATAKKIIIVSPNRTLYLDADIKDVALSNNAIFILEKDGTVIKTDYNLKKTTEKKFEFAIFIKSNIYKDFLYLFEKTGYLVKMDLNLDNIQIFKLSEAVDKMSFMGNDKFYYEDKILDLL
ncbi:hypothetical protein LNU06_01485 [Campylobacter sp. VicNov18]|uniref:hypothetical protein n=1 Tax=Campylobacter bilis TaxID=2691918 RepID=UPI00130D9F4D|nr:hypothetical protein [Campylobacter bilis]MPV63339.1 hypothetical protein [Campylobacter hepaticus]MBM0636838.1 hypothetical protein [Campylobacter bilis]MCC8277409.1 hypothetical protein [Campylobacter bilis]MCC8299152.1 hypothetical protein [Campylobacter bilis]MCC8300318.1 hypothetical protein [Campylobacter bilis]